MVFFKDVENKDRDGIFRGIAIFVNGYTDPTADELKRIMMVNGGIYHHYKSSKTTHIIGKKKHVIWSVFIFYLKLATFGNVLEHIFLIRIMIWVILQNTC